MLVTVIFGSNSGDKKSTIENAIALVASRTGKINTSSSLYETAPWGFESEECFLNQVVVYESLLSPIQFLNACLTIEQELGRTREAGVRYTSRSIDIDLLFCDDLSLHTPDLILPHPRIPERRFVLEPLNEIMPEFIHPGTQKSISRMLQECPDQLPVKILTID